MSTEKANMYKIKHIVHTQKIQNAVFKINIILQLLVKQKSAFKVATRY